jgi:hypothetical protein
MCIVQINEYLCYCEIVAAIEYCDDPDCEAQVLFVGCPINLCRFKGCGRIPLGSKRAKERGSSGLV